MKSKLFTFMLALFATGAALFAQVRVTGVVKDDTGYGVIGASVMEKGTQNGAVTDLDGKYEIRVKAGATLVFSSIGYATQEIAVGNRSVIDVLLELDTELLDEVVVVGYGTMKRSDLSGASVSMKEEDLRGSIITNLDQSLQGRAAGVTAVSTSGAPGSSSSIRVRGQATVNAGAEPLYVIDGVIVQGGGTSGGDFGLGGLGNGRVSTISPLATINPADIVSMEILKDASATAIYGAQGANGVVLITTKHGKSGEAKFSYDGMVAVSRQMSRIDMMNLRQFAEYYNDLVDQGLVDHNAWYADPSVLGKGTDWQDEDRQDPVLCVRFLYEPGRYHHRFQLQPPVFPHQPRRTAQELVQARPQRHVCGNQRQHQAGRRPGGCDLLFPVHDSRHPGL